jgi:two-component system sensor kinase FixL
MFNPAARVGLGLDADPRSGIGLRVTEVGAADVAREVTRLETEVLDQGGTRRIDLERRVGGETRHYDLSKTPWRDAAGRTLGVLTVARDITEMRAAQARLRGLQADLLRATRLSSMGAMASGLAHEINQPLAAATNFLNAALRLLDRAPPGDPAALATMRGAVADAAAQTLRAGQIVRRLREFVERGGAELSMEDIGGVVDETCALARADGADGGIPLLVEVEDNIGSAAIDRIQLQQVLINLLRNAAEAICQRGAREEDRITLAVRRVGAERLTIEVADNGPGFDPAVVASLFQPFVSTKPQGLGIGLAICRSIVEGHGGSLTAGQAAGGGGLFTITLPTRGCGADGAS